MSQTAHFTPAEVCAMLEVPPTTLRRYCDSWEEFLNPRAHSTGKKRRYTDNDILILHKVKAMTRNRRPPEEIRAALTVVTPESEPAGNVLALLPSVIAEFDSLRAQIAALQSEQTETQDRLKRLEAWLKMPWYKKLINRPPE
jgi:DNA-binding transcriptional MerR regulator